jgi:hypothetical protein
MTELAKRQEGGKGGMYWQFCVIRGQGTEHTAQTVQIGQTAFQEWCSEAPNLFSGQLRQKSGFNDFYSLKHTSIVFLFCE